MCPIVPTFMCGLDRSNFSLAIAAVCSSRVLGCSLLPYGPPLHPRDDLFGNRARSLLVSEEVHGIRRPALRARAQVGGIAEHFGERHFGANDLRRAALLHTLDVTATPCQVAEYIT